MEVLDVAELLWEQIVARDLEIHDKTKQTGKARIRNHHYRTLFD